MDLELWITFTIYQQNFFIYLILCVIYYLRILIQVSDIFAFHKKKRTSNNTTQQRLYFILFFISIVEQFFVFISTSLSKPSDASSHSVTRQWFHPVWGSRRFNPHQSPSHACSWMRAKAGTAAVTGSLLGFWLINDVSRDGTCSRTEINLPTVFYSAIPQVFSSLGVRVWFLQLPLLGVCEYQRGSEMVCVCVSERRGGCVCVCSVRDGAYVISLMYELWELETNSLILGTLLRQTDFWYHQ